MADYGARLRIENHHGHPALTKVWLNDMPLHEGGMLERLTVEWDPSGDCGTVATLRLTVGDLEVDAQTIIALQAHVLASESSDD